MTSSSERLQQLSWKLSFLLSLSWTIQTPQNDSCFRATFPRAQQPVSRKKVTCTTWTQFPVSLLQLTKFYSCHIILQSPATYFRSPQRCPWVIKSQIISLVTPEHLACSTAHAPVSGNNCREYPHPTTSMPQSCKYFRYKAMVPAWSGKNGCLHYTILWEDPSNLISESNISQWLPRNSWHLAWKLKVFSSFHCLKEKFTKNECSPLLEGPECSPVQSHSIIFLESWCFSIWSLINLIDFFHLSTLFYLYPL